MATTFDNRMRVLRLWGDTRIIRYYVTNQNELNIKYPKPMIDKLLEIKEEFGNVTVQFEVDIQYKNVRSRKYYIHRENTLPNVYESYKDIIDAEKELNDHIENYYAKTIQFIKICEYRISINKCENPKMHGKQVNRLQVRNNVDGHDRYIRYITTDRKELRAKFPEEMINKLKEVKEKLGDVKVEFKVALKYEDYDDDTILERISSSQYIYDSTENLGHFEDIINTQIEDIETFNDLIKIEEYICIVDKINK